MSIPTTLTLSPRELKLITRLVKTATVRAELRKAVCDDALDERVLTDWLEKRLDAAIRVPNVLRGA